MPVSKSDLIDQIAEETGVSKKDVKTIIDGMLGRVTTNLKRGEKVRLTGFGTFEVRERKARSGVKPGTSVRIDLPSDKYPAFKAGTALSKSVHKPYRKIREPAVPSELDTKRLEEVLRRLPDR